MANKSNLKKITPQIVETLKKNKIKKASIFGSFARGEDNKNSDVDVLIETKKGMSLFGFVGIKLELEDKLGRKVDLVTYKSLHPYLRKKILDEEVRII